MGYPMKRRPHLYALAGAIFLFAGAVRAEAPLGETPVGKIPVGETPVGKTPVGGAAPTAKAGVVLSETACAALAHEDFSGVEDAPTRVSEARYVAANASRGAYCVVEGYVWRNVRFRARFPASGWNGKLVVEGSGGQAGNLWPEELVSASPRDAVRRGYAVVAHDGGHFSTVADAQWGWNNDSAQIDYGFRAAHVAGLAGRAVIGRAYGTAPLRAYFTGCSSGGREALMMAQRYPWDFDGVIAGAPTVSYEDVVTTMAWMVGVLSGPAGEMFTPEAAKTLHAAVLAQCDRTDGRADGVIDDPRRCRIDLQKIRCGPGQAADCLTEGQIDVASRLYDGPRTPTGERVAASTMFYGSELTWLPIAALARDYPNEAYRYLAFSPAPGPGFRADIRKIGDYRRRMGQMGALFSPSNPDISTFKGRGGKLLSYYGWQDAIGGGANVMRYYDTVERTLGGPDRTRDVFRLFMIPGMEHCGGGDGAWQIDWLDVLDRWVETGKAPDEVQGRRPATEAAPESVRSYAPYVSAPLP